MSTLKVNAIRGTGASSDAISVNSTDGTCTASITNNLSNRNLVVNGAMQISQYAEYDGTTTHGRGAVDRWAHYRENVDENPTFSQGDVASGTTPYELGFRKSLKTVNGNQTSGAGADDYISYDYKWEAQDIADSGWNYTSTSSYLTFSFWVKSSVAQNFYFHIKTSDGTAQNYPMETGSLSANTWTKITKQIPGNSNLQFDHDRNEGLQLRIILYRGTNKTGSITLNQWAAWNTNVRVPDNTTTWYTTNDATFEITGVQLEVDHTGSGVATAFEHRTFGDELARCQRYYYRHAFGNQAAPYQMPGNNSHPVGMCAIYTASSGFGYIQFPVTMRTQPTLDVATGTGYYIIYANNGTDKFNDLAQQQYGTTNAVVNYYDGFSKDTGHAGWIQLSNANAYIAFSAEL